MTGLPNPWINECALEASTPAHAAAGPEITDPPVPAAAIQSAADHPCAPTTAGAGANAVPASLDRIDHIHEIFHFARKLLADYHAKHHRFVLDEVAFCEAIEPMPMFLQASA